MSAPRRGRPGTVRLQFHLIAALLVAGPLGAVLGWRFHAHASTTPPPPAPSPVRLVAEPARSPRVATTRAPSGRYRFTHPLTRIELGAQDDFPGLAPLKRALTAGRETQRGLGRVERAAVYFEDLESGEWAGIDEEERFDGASLLKVPVMMWWLGEAEARPGLLADRLVFAGQGDFDRAQTIGERPRLEQGHSYTISDLLYNMISYSDNNSAALLLGRPGSAIDQVYSDLGVDVSAAEHGRVSPRSFATSFLALYDATYLGRHMSEAALALLASARFRDGLVAGVPPGTVVAHKFAERTHFDGDDRPLTRELHDCGIVYHPEAPYLLCVMTSGRDLVAQAAALAELSRIAWAKAGPIDHASPPPR